MACTHTHTYLEKVISDIKKVKSGEGDGRMETKSIQVMLMARASLILVMIRDLKEAEKWLWFILFSLDLDVSEF